MPRRCDRGLVADRGHHILQRSPRGCMVVDIVGGEDRQSCGARQGIEPFDPRAIVPGVEIGGGDMVQRGELNGEIGEYLGQRSCLFARSHENAVRRRRRSPSRHLTLRNPSASWRTASPWIRQLRVFVRTQFAKRHHGARHGDGEALFEIARRHQHKLHAFRMIRQHGERDLACTLGLPFAIELRHATRRDQPAQASIGSAILRIGEEGQALDRFYPTADKRLEFKRFRFGVYPDHSRHAVGIGDPERIVPQFAGSKDEIDRIRCAAQEAEARDHPQFDEGRARRRI